MMRPMAKYYVVSVKTQPFSPLDLSPALWLDASDTTTITESSGAVSEWRDKSGNARHVSQGTAANQPTTGAATLNGLNVITFSDNTKNLKTSSLEIRTWFDPANWTNTTVAFVSMVGNSSLQRGFIAALGTSYRLSIDQRGGSGNYYDLGSDGGGRLAGNDGVANNSNNLILARRAGSSIVVRRNKSQVLSTNGASGAVASGESAQMQLGSNPFGGFVGSYAEIIIFASALSDTDRDKLETYLATKWGL